MTDPFEDLILQLGSLLKQTLHVDRHRACALRVENKFTVQIQLDKEQENLIIASCIKELPPGKYRENVLSEALKTNHLLLPYPGTFGYLALKSSLTLHRTTRFAPLTALALEGFLAEFIDTAKAWYTAISHGESSPAPIRGTPPEKPKPFGLR